MGWPAIAALALASGVGSTLSSGRKQARYTPNPVWLSMQEDVMRGIKEGLKQGGYTFSEATVNALKEQALADISTRFKGAEERIRSATAPYGAIGALNRGVTSLHTERALAEAGATRDIDITRETQRLNSQQQLLGLGARIPDPMLPQASMPFVPTASARLGESLTTGLATGVNFWQAQQNRNMINSLYNKGLGQAISPLTQYVPPAFGLRR